jgi:hypothetical protein
MSELLSHRGMIYDPKKDYLGPENSDLSNFIPKTPPGMEFLHPEWNKAAFFHDGDYKGKKLKGLWGRIRNWFIRKLADDNFFNRLANSLDDALEDESISQSRYEFGMIYAKTCHKAVRYGGWKFYRIEE